LEGLAGKLLIAGFLLILLGMGLIIIGGLSQVGRSSVGMVFFIGPIPIVFSSGPDSFPVLLISLILAAFMILMTWLTFYHRREG
jgi:uncharacterized membrane protein